MASRLKISVAGFHPPLQRINCASRSRLAREAQAFTLPQTARHGRRCFDVR